jgi:hypothetical protein
MSGPVVVNNPDSGGSNNGLLLGIVLTIVVIVGAIWFFSNQGSGGRGREAERSREADRSATNLEIAIDRTLDNGVDRFLGFTRVRQQVPARMHRRCTNDDDRAPAFALRGDDDPPTGDGPPFR